MPRLAAAIVAALTLLCHPKVTHSAAILGLSQVKSKAASTCRCDCCITEGQRDPDAAALAAAGADSRLQCSYDLTRGFAGEVQREECGNLCTRQASDEVLASAEDSEMDTQRFCFFECEPSPLRDVTNPQPGDACKPLSHNESLMVRDASGNARPPMEVPHVMSHFLARRAARKTAVESRSDASVHATSATAVVPFAPLPGEDWSSISTPAKMQSAAITQMAQEAAIDAIQAKLALADINKVAGGAAGSLLTARVAAENARKESEEASKAEARVHEIRDGLYKRTVAATKEALPGVIKQMRTVARAKAKIEALNEASKLQTEMETGAAVASQEAMKPFQAAMAGMGETANQYISAADKLSAESATMQMGAQTAQTQADQYMGAGALPFAQKAMVQSRQLMNQAVTASNTADAYYDTAAKIQNTLPEYAVEAEAAANHAGLLVNPDMLPATGMV